MVDALKSNKKSIKYLSGESYFQKHEICLEKDQAVSLKYHSFLENQVLNSRD